VGRAEKSFHLKRLLLLRTALLEETSIKLPTLVARLSLQETNLVGKGFKTSN
jgi:hypothetical protein